MPKDIRAGGLFVDLAMNVARLEKDSRTAIGVVKGFEQNLKAIAGNIQKVFVGSLVAGLTVGIGKAALELGNHLADIGEKAGDIATGFEKLGGSTQQIELAKQATLGMVDSFDLMAIANKGLLAGIPSFNENFSEIAELGARVADTLGKDTKTSIEDLTDAIIKGNAKALRPLGFEFSQTKDKAKVAREALAQLPAVIERIAPVTDSVKTAQDALNVAWQEASKEAGIAFNENENLRIALRNLLTLVESADFKNLVGGLADVSAKAIQAATDLGSFAASLLNVAQKANLFSSDQIAGAMLADEVKRAFGEAGKQISETFKLTDKSGKAAGETFKATRGELEAQAKAAKKAAEETAKFAEQWEKVTSQSAKSSLKSQIDDAIKSLNTADFSRLTEEMRKVVEDGFVKEWQKAIDSGAVSLEEVTKQAALEGQKVVDEYSQQLEDKSIEAYENSINTWRGLFENAITGVTFDLESALKQVAVGFAAELAHAVLGSLAGINIASPADLGGAIFNGIFGGLVGGAGGAQAGSGLGAIGMGAIGGGIIGSFGMSAAGAQAAGIAGPAMANGMFANGAGLLGALGPWGVAALAGGALIGGNAFGIRDKISGLFGGGPTHPETIARKEMIGFLEEKLGRDIKLGSNSRFNNPDWTKGFDSFSTEAKQSAFGIADALQHVLGVTEDVAGQIALVMLEDTGGSIEKLAEMFSSLGISAEEAQEAIIEAGIKAGETWVEIEGKLQGIDRASKDAESSAKSSAEAFENLAKGNASGMDDIASVVAIAVQAQKEGIKSLEELQAKLTAQFGADKVKPFFDALDALGITSLDQLANASTRTAGAIIANMQASGFAFEGLVKNIDKATDATNKLADAQERIGGQAAATQGEVETSAARISKGGTRMAAAVIDTSAIKAMSMQRQTRRISLGDTSGVRPLTVVVNAPGGDAGAEERILNALQHVEERAVSRAVNRIGEMAERGGLFG